jgi:transposase InsO family protein
MVRGHRLHQHVGGLAVSGHGHRPGLPPVVGWAVADHLRTDLVDAALTDAIRRRRPASGLIFHADRGCQYTSTQHARLAKRHGIRLSLSRRGQCWDNAVAESFFATIKTHLLHRQAWPTREAARQAIFEYVEGWYNTRRRHSSLGYLSPATYEATGLSPVPASNVA